LVSRDRLAAVSARDRRAIVRRGVLRDQLALLPVPC
jgi:hypothetical protein